MYVTPNFKTKKELRLAIAADSPVTYYQPGLSDTPLNGTIYVEGPHYPKPHRWYATCKVRDGKIISVK